MMKKKIFLLVSTVFSYIFSSAQDIRMHFPSFSGKTYEFIIFQGSRSVKVQEGSIAEDGRVMLKIPDQYAPYKGMSRWLLTNSKDGGGLDMYIPGNGFSVSCTSATPDEHNITYEGYDPFNPLNILSMQQQRILDKYQLMDSAARLYENDNLHGVFIKERDIQKKHFADFVTALKADTSFAGRLLPIINITRGIPLDLGNEFKETSRDIAGYISHELDMEVLYTSGHWSAVLETWGQIEAELAPKDTDLVNSFKELSSRIDDPVQYTDFVTCITRSLTRYGKDHYINLIAPYIVTSGKITEYSGMLSVYQKSLIGHLAPDLHIRHLVTGREEGNSPVILSSRDFAVQPYKNTLIIFYETGCGACTGAINTLKKLYPEFKNYGVRIIAISADQDEQVFRREAALFPWKDTYCDFEGWKGENFTNYAVSATPTLFFVNKNGKIIDKVDTVEEILTKLK